VSFAMRKLLDDLGLHRTGLEFYTLRHVFLTIARSRGTKSRSHTSLATLFPAWGRAVCEHVRGRLLGKGKKRKPR
jgi:hypothetical protein